MCLYFFILESIKLINFVFIFFYSIDIRETRRILPPSQPLTIPINGIICCNLIFEMIQVINPLIERRERKNKINKGMCLMHFFQLVVARKLCSFER